MPNYHVADIIARIKNALQLQRSTVTLPNTNFVYAFVTCLIREGYIEEISTSNLGTSSGTQCDESYSLDNSTPAESRLGPSGIAGLRRGDAVLPTPNAAPTEFTVTFATARKSSRGSLGAQSSQVTSSREGIQKKLLKKSAAPQSYAVMGERFERLIPVLTSLVCVSRPGTRVYVKCKNIPPVLGGLGTHVLSTSKGLMTSREAVKLNLGGELLCTLW